MVCELLLDRGDYILTEEYTYPSVIESVIIPKGYKALGVKLDQDGILPDSLLEVSFLLTLLEYVQCSTNAASMHALQVHDIATPQVTCGADSAATMQCQPFAVSCFSLSHNNTLEGLLGI
jgi:hypothetical protein